ncbi:nicotinate-nicotinamide nucleotide adenylyltransferase [Lysobacter sp. Root667]|uniref:nicotinate-nucleotide adenylyltransferase n=1 Tax=Lysobacter sp. Root667 TaxID=1736581 RepID=UPI0006FBAF1E|nr:nicotinate-nucleotide adenylyltransferase [Lysobacter sp. Root667]KRA77213.1 nicotinate-nicotinamide nucleotide adenylyltransferase [Lysobacter sp. Root667]
MSLRVYYGGTFDPVHDGHLAIARAARDALDATIRLMPAADPPHRAPPGANAAQRARMLDLAVAGEPRLLVDTRELARAGRSYTVETLRELRREIGDAAPVALLVGADSFLGLPQWHEWRSLFDLAHFVVAQRPSSPLEQGLAPELAALVAGRDAADAAALRAAPAGRVLRLNQPLHAESASEVRQRIAAGQPWQDLVPAPVAVYIERHGLYGGQAAAGAPL